MSRKVFKVLYIFMIFYGLVATTNAVTDEQVSYIEELSAKINVPIEYFLFDVESAACGKDLSKVTRCALVPVHDIYDHQDCMKAMFGDKGDKEYMQYYLDGHLTTDDIVEQKVAYSISRMSGDNPHSLTLMMTYGDKTVGRIAVGPISLGNCVVPEVGYSIRKEYSGKGITTASVKCLLGIMQRMIDNKDKRYSFITLRATSKPTNKTSNAILVGVGFKKSKNKIDDGYGEENEYYYKFNVKENECKKKNSKK